MNRPHSGCLALRIGLPLSLALIFATVGWADDESETSTDATAPAARANGNGVTTKPATSKSPATKAATTKTAAKSTPTKAGPTKTGAAKSTATKSGVPKSAGKAEALPENVTYAKHIAPILWKNCASCHRSGEVGPFSLMTYKDAQKRADFIAEVTADRRMPPWKAEVNFGKFHDERRLSDREIKLLAKWAEQGAPPGEKEDLPKRPEFAEGWQLGEPDLVLKMPESFEVPAAGRDIYRCFVIPVPIEKDRMVTAVEFRPGNRKIVHHAIMYLDALGAAKAKDGADGKPGYANSGGGPEILPTGSLGGWAPGATPRFLPEGVVMYLKKGSDLVLQIHYHPSGKAEKDESMVGVYFNKTPAKKVITGVAVAQTGLELPAGQKRAAVKAESHALPVDVSVLSISPHMHNLGKEFKVFATRPGTKAADVPLIWIKDWDFNWQGAYHFEKPVKLAKGSIVKVESVYDNSAENPRNPHKPPKTIKWGEQTTDEMLLVSMQVTTDRPSDLKLVAMMPGNEFGAGLEGGIPGQTEIVKRLASKHGMSATDMAKAAAAAKKEAAAKGAAAADAMPAEEAEEAPAVAAAPPKKPAAAPAAAPTGDEAPAAEAPTAEAPAAEAVAKKGEPKDEAEEKDTAKEKDAKKAGGLTVKGKDGEEIPFPAGGFELRTQNEKTYGGILFDKNKDGYISKEEFDSITDPYRKRMIKALKQRNKEDQDAAKAKAADK